MSAIRPDVNSYFADDPQLLQVFEIDYEAYIAFYGDMMFWQIFCVPPCFLPCVPISLAAYFLNSKPNLEDLVNAIHVAITRDGIKYVIDRHKAGCRCSCEDVGKVSKTVPFDKITDCDVEEPAGAELCGIVPKTLFTVNVDTASGAGGHGGHELSILGLKDPHGFKKMVRAVKRGEYVATVADGVKQSVPPMQSQNIADRDGGFDRNNKHQGAAMTGGNIGGTESLTVLRSIDARMELQNKLLQEILASKQPVM